MSNYDYDNDDHYFCILFLAAFYPVTIMTLTMVVVAAEVCSKHLVDTRLYNVNQPLGVDDPLKAKHLTLTLNTLPPHQKEKKKGKHT